MGKNIEPKVDQDVTLLLHGLRFPATVDSVNEDGSINVTAIAVNNKQPFPKHNVQRAPADPDPGVAYWTTEPVPSKAEPPSSDAK